MSFNPWENVKDIHNWMKEGVSDIFHSIVPKAPKMPAAPVPLPPMPSQMDPQIELARQGILERYRQMKGRAASQVTTPKLMAQTPELLKLGLKEKLG